MQSPVHGAKRRAHACRHRRAALAFLVYEQQGGTQHWFELGECALQHARGFASLHGLHRVGLLGAELVRAEQRRAQAAAAATTSVARCSARGDGSQVAGGLGGTGHVAAACMDYQKNFLQHVVEISSGDTEPGQKSRYEVCILSEQGSAIERVGRRRGAHRLWMLEGVNSLVKKS